MSKIISPDPNAKLYTTLTAGERIMRFLGGGFFTLMGAAALSNGFGWGALLATAVGFCVLCSAFQTYTRR